MILQEPGTAPLHNRLLLFRLRSPFCQPSAEPGAGAFQLPQISKSSMLLGYFFRQENRRTGISWSLNTIPPESIGFVYIMETIIDIPGERESNDLTIFIY